MPQKVRATALTKPKNVLLCNLGTEHLFLFGSVKILSLIHIQMCIRDRSYGISGNSAVSAYQTQGGLGKTMYAYLINNMISPYSTTQRVKGGLLSTIPVSYTHLNPVYLLPCYSIRKRLMQRATPALCSRRVPMPGICLLYTSGS